MTAPRDPSRSKGMAMIAAYRAARFAERPALRARLRGARADPAGKPREEPEPASAAAPSEPAAAPDPADPGSVFAGLVSLAAAERSAALPDPEPTAPNGAEAAPVPPAAPDPAGPQGRAAPEPELPPDPPLAEIGFGPGMLIRLSQLGLRTIGDLARSDAAALRQALGDISRLVDVETWIENARDTTRDGGKRPK